MSKDETQQSRWMQQIAKAPGSMTQRRLTSVEKWPGGVRQLIAEAQRQGVHLVQLTDDHGEILIGASTHEFKVLA